MSNNFLVRQILKTGGSFFVGASIAMLEKRHRFIVI